MNVERLHALAVAIIEDIDRSKLRDSLGQALTHISQSLDNPADQSHQDNFQKIWALLERILRDSSVNRMALSWRNLTRHIGCYELLGLPLWERIKKSRDSNNMTPRVFVKELGEAKSQLDTAYSQLTTMRGTFEHFKLEADTAEVEEAQIEVVIPRELLNGEIERFAKELMQLEKRLLNPIHELTVGSPEPFRIRTLATSEFDIVVLVTQIVGGVITNAIGKCAKWFISRRKTMKARDDAEQSGYPKKILEEMDVHLEHELKAAIEEAALSLIEEHSRKNTDKNDIRPKIQGAIRYLINRMNEGYVFDVPPVKRLESDDLTEELKDQREQQAKNAAAVTALVNEVEQHRVPGRPLLQLPHLPEEEEAEGDVPKQKRATAKSKTPKRPSKGESGPD